MMKWLIAYGSAAVVFGVLDALWLRWAGPNFYRPAIGEVMAESFRAAPAGVFYFLYLAGMCWFAIRPGLEAGSVGVTALNAALLGALCYATYDLTNQAVMKVWPTYITIADIAWGAFATCVAASAATFITLRFT